MAGATYTPPSPPTVDLVTFFSPPFLISISRVPLITKVLFPLPAGRLGLEFKEPFPRSLGRTSSYTTTITTNLTTVSTYYLSLLVAFPFDRLLILINYRLQPTTNRPFLVAKQASSVSSRCSALRSPDHPFTKLLRLAQL
ncbi:hypothetical protein E4U33_006745 [Claviceps sp. LM78 group G4]|nr:hypothetical protein E4U33_006745 [Claviceps sp. LM78 group G4]